MKSNASLLTFLTISEPSEEKIFFGYLKELEEVAPDKPHWYKGKGSHGNAIFLWEEKKVKQWTVVGNDKFTQALFQDLSSKFELNINLGSVNKKFTAPQFEKEVVKDNIYAIPDVDNCDKGDRPDDFICKSWHTDISFFLNEEKNCEFISGYKHFNGIKQVEPYGLFYEKFLFQKLNKKICFVYDSRGVFYSLRGVRKDTKKDPTKYFGFVQEDLKFKTNSKVIIRDISGTRTLGESEIDPTNGRWSMDLSEAINKGEFLFVDKTTGKFLCGEKFYLIKDISLNTQIVSITIKDLFGRDINIVSNEGRVAPLSESVVWHSSSAPSDKQSEIELSDRISQILLSLGKSIIISDPYFLGEIIVEDSQLKLSKSQLVFMNALVIALAKGGIEELNILGSWRKASSLSDGSQEKFIEGYKAIYKALKATFTNSSYLKLKTFNICFSKQPFHDRYVLNGKDENVIYSVSNSINGIIQSTELMVLPLTQIDIFKIRPKVLQRFEESDKYNLIY
ncbi:MAG: hypothetical protein JNK50_01105 [Bacteroidia bacterium]|nr:hypothetical protein [Bacteroidia bacterium]